MSMHSNAYFWCTTFGVDIYFNNTIIGLIIIYHNKIDIIYQILCVVIPMRIILISLYLLQCNNISNWYPGC